MDLHPGLRDYVPGVSAALHRSRRQLAAVSRTQKAGAGEPPMYVGDAVGFVVAESLRQARNAADALVVDYGVLPAVP